MSGDFENILFFLRPQMSDPLLYDLRKRKTNYDDK